MALSRERIAQELTRLLILPDPRYAIKLMIENGIFAPFLPEISPQAVQNLSCLIDRQNQYEIPASFASRLLAILPDNDAIADKVAMRLKLSSRLRAELADRLKFLTPDASNIRSIAYHTGIRAAQDSALLRCQDEDLKICLEQIEGWQIPDFSIRGGDLLTKGLPAGPIIAKTLQSIEARWIENGFPFGAELDAITDQLIAGALSASK